MSHSHANTDATVGGLGYVWKHHPDENPPSGKHVRRPSYNAEKAAEWVAIVAKALALAGVKVSSMKTFLDNHPDDAVLMATPQWQSSFGLNADPSAVRRTVEKMFRGEIKIHSADPKHADAAIRRSQEGVNAYTRSYLDHMGSIHFGSIFYTGSTEQHDYHRAGTIIHEASHYLARTGDCAHPDTGRIIKAHQKVPKDAKISYLDSPYFQDLLRTSPNMEDNADSFRGVAQACHPPAPRR